MNYNYQKATQLLRSYSRLKNQSYPADKDYISYFESELNVVLPKSYRKFLQELGQLDFGSQEIYGSFNDVAISSTKYERETCRDPSFPKHYVVIHELGNGEISCLDTSRMNPEGECPVVGWYFGYSEDIAEDFGAFLLEKIQWAIEGMEEENEK